jgi:hypothetical protein
MWKETCRRHRRRCCLVVNDKFTVHRIGYSTTQSLFTPLESVMYGHVLIIDDIFSSVIFSTVRTSSSRPLCRLWISVRKDLNLALMRSCPSATSATTTTAWSTATPVPSTSPWSSAAEVTSLRSSSGPPARPNGRACSLRARRGEGQGHTHATPPRTRALPSLERCGGECLLARESPAGAPAVAEHGRERGWGSQAGAYSPSRSQAR